MPYVKNPNYNPNDPKSKRYIFKAEEAFSSFLNPNSQGSQFTPNTSVAPSSQVQSEPRVKLTPQGAPVDLATSKTKTSTPKYNTSAVAPNAITATATATTPTATTPSAGGAYQVKSGDTLGAIASRNNTTVAELQRLNPQITNANLIYPGQNIKLPGSTAPPQPGTPQTTPTSPLSSGAVPTTPTTTQPSPSGTLPTTEIGAGQAAGAGPSGDVGFGSGAAGATYEPNTGDAQSDEALRSLAVKAGQAGMSLDDYLKLVGAASGPTKEQSEEIRNRLGIPGLIDDVFEPPQQSTVEMYKELYGLSGLDDVKASIKELDNEISKKRDDLVKATGDLYSNPWISQATRSGRLGNLTRIALADIQNSIDQKTQYLDLYDRGITEIENSINRSVYDQGIERNLTVDKLNFLLTEAESDLQFAQRAVEQRGLRYVPDFLENQPVEAAEGFTLSEGQVRYDAAGNVIARGPSPAGGTGKLVEIGGQKYIQNADGSFSLPILPETPVDTEQVEGLLGKVDLIDSILDSNVLENVVGSQGVSRLSTGFSAGEKANFAAGVEQLINQETIDTLVNLKERGGTLGALSDQERILLQTAATKLASWQLKDDDGNPTGKYKVSEKAFKAEVNRIRDLAQRAISKATGISPEKQDEVSYLRQQYGISTEEAIKRAGIGTQQSSAPLSPLAASIVEQESGGNYNAVGQVPAGYSEADRALGKYQIIPKYHFDKIGLANTPENRQLFLNSPELQDELFSKIIQGLSDQYNGDAAKVAAAYYGGAGGAAVVGTAAGDRPQYAGGQAYPSINQYVNSVLSRITV